MRKTQLIPKIIAAVIFLIVAIIISAPVFSVSMNRIFGGGIVEFGTAESVEYIDYRPVEGVLSYIIGGIGDESGDDFTLKNGTYYYLVSISGKGLAKDKKGEVVLLKTLTNSDSYEELNEILRAKHAEESLRISGVVKKASENEEKIAEKICIDNNIKNAEYIGFCIDCTKPVSSYTARSLLSLIFYAGFIVSVLLSVQSLKRNRDIDNMEHRRAIMMSARDLKDNDPNANGADALFGDADRSFVSDNTQYQGAGQSPTEVVHDLEQQAKNNAYVNNQNTFTKDDGFFGEQSNSEDKYDGFFGS